VLSEGSKARPFRSRSFTSGAKQSLVQEAVLCFLRKARSLFLKEAELVSERPSESFTSGGLMNLF
jgi:hypothetical protein